MDFCGVYDKQVSEQSKLACITPLWGGWEFRQKPGLPVGWLALAKAYDWELPAPVRHDLLSGQWSVVVTDATQVIQYVNASFEQMTGYTSDEAIGRRPGFLQGPETNPLARQRIRKAIANRKVANERVLNYRKDQSMYWCHIIIRPIVNRHKEVVSFIAFEQEIAIDEQPDYQ